jgi:hypothetical protein
MKTEYFLTFANRRDRELKVPRWFALWASHHWKSSRYVSVTARVTNTPGCASVEDGSISNVSMSAWDFLKIL